MNSECPFLEKLDTLKIFLCRLVIFCQCLDNPDVRLQASISLASNMYMRYGILIAVSYCSIVGLIVKFLFDLQQKIHTIYHEISQHQRFRDFCLI